MLGFVPFPPQPLALTSFSALARRRRHVPLLPDRRPRVRIPWIVRPVSSPTVETIDGTRAIWELPAAARDRAVLFVAHGCRCPPDNFWPPSPRYPGCVGSRRGVLVAGKGGQQRQTGDPVLGRGGPRPDGTLRRRPPSRNGFLSIPLVIAQFLPGLLHILIF